MTRIKVKSLVWDEWNIRHIKKHGIDIEEVEKAGKNLIYHRKTYRNRYLVIGRSKSRSITLILNRKRAGTYYVVTARDASRKERRKINEKQR